MFIYIYENDLLLIRALIFVCILIFNMRVCENKSSF